MDRDDRACGVAGHVPLGRLACCAFLISGTHAITLGRHQRAVGAVAHSRAYAPQRTNAGPRVAHTRVYEQTVAPARLVGESPASVPFSDAPGHGSRLACVGWCLTGIRSPGVVIGAAGARRFRLCRPPDVELGERLPLRVMPPGCRQDAASFAVIRCMNRVARREGFVVLYPKRLGHALGHSARHGEFRLACTDRHAMSGHRQPAPGPMPLAPDRA